MNIKTNTIAKIAAVVAGLGLVAMSFAYAPSSHAASYPVGGTQYYLAGAGVNATATTIQLTSLKTADGRNITMSMFGAIGYAAIDPQTVAKLEDISFTGITQNSNGTALLTGVTRGMDFVTPYAGTASLGTAHSGGATFILTNTAGYYGNQFAFINNPNVFTDYNTFLTPIAGSNPATKSYVDNLVSGGTITSTSVIAPGTAGETVVAGNLLYLNTADARWYKAATTIPGSINDAVTALAQGAGTSGSTIAGGVLLKGLDTNQSGLTTGANYFTTSVAGTIGTATTSKAVGKARNTTSIYFDQYFTGYASTGANNSFSGTNTFSATTTITATSSATIGAFPAWQIGKQHQYFTTVGTTTFSVPSGITKVHVITCGGGGGGGGLSGAGASAGAGGAGCALEDVDLTGTTTVQVHVGDGGTAGPSSSTGGGLGDWSTFGTNGFYNYGLGGNPSGINTGIGSGASASGGDLNIDGMSGSLGVSGNASGIGGATFLGSIGRGANGTGGGGSSVGTPGIKGSVLVTW